MSDEQNALREVEGLLDVELAEAKETNQRSLMIGGVFVVLIGGYLFWASSQFSKLLDPEGLALAASGMALDALPDASASLRELVVDGAPDIATAASQAIVDMLPTYRQVMEDEMEPVIDEVANILAVTAVGAMIESVGSENEEAGTLEALNEGADAVVTRLDTLLEESMDDDGPTPRDTIEESLGQLQTIDRGLKRIANGGGDPQERELLMAWMNLMSQWNDDANAAAIDEREDAKYAGEKAPAEAPAEAPEAPAEEPEKK
jgi:hypothetical protein